MRRTRTLVAGALNDRGLNPESTKLKPSALATEQSIYLIELVPLRAPYLCLLDSDLYIFSPVHAPQLHNSEDEQNCTTQWDFYRFSVQLIFLCSWRNMEIQTYSRPTNSSSTVIWKPKRRVSSLKLLMY